MSYYNPNDPFQSALVQRNAANTVRFVASLVSGHEYVRERQAGMWAAEVKSRTILWRLSNPFAPKTMLTKDQITALTIHESGHLEYTGSWDMPKDVDDPKRFFRFWNGAEDIRIDRLLKTRFPGTKGIFHDLHAMCDSMITSALDPKKTKLSLADEVMVLGFLNLAEDLPISKKASKKAKEFIDKWWPMMDYIGDTALSSAEVVRRILPMYKELMEEGGCTGEEEGDKSGTLLLVGGEASEGEGEEGGEGGPQEPHLSTDKEGNPGKSLTFGEFLEGLTEDATGDKAPLRVLVKNEEDACKLAEKQANESIGWEASGVHGENTAWDMTKQSKRGNINRLSSRLETVLEFKKTETWETRLKRGHFDSGHAHRSLRGDMRVFRKKTIAGRVDDDFMITVDMSYSQSGRVRELLASTVVASEAIEKCEMGLAIVTWDGKMRHFKTWEKPLQSVKGAIGYDLSHAAGGTVESRALRVAEAMIIPRLRMGRQVFLITLTDGQTQKVEDSKEIIYDMEQAGVKTIGIGVMHTAPRHYKTQLEVANSEELANVLPNLLRDIVRRG